MATRQNQSRSLPLKASAEYLRKEAKRFAKHHGIKIAAAQRALAHEYGHKTWAELMIAVKAVVKPAHTTVGAETMPPHSSDAPQLGDEEWSAIRNLAEVSLNEMPAAPSVKQWLDNRRSFPAANGIQQQFVATLGERIVGYGCAEHPPAWMRKDKEAAGEYRLFMVVEPSARRTLGSRLLAKLQESLISSGARRAWFQEYQADTGLISFLEEKGFVKAVSFRTEKGEQIVRLAMKSPFESLSQPAQRPNDAQADPSDKEERQ